MGRVEVNATPAGSTETLDATTSTSNSPKHHSYYDGSCDALDSYCNSYGNTAGPSSVVGDDDVGDIVGIDAYEIVIAAPQQDHHTLTQIFLNIVRLAVPLNVSQVAQLTIVLVMMSSVGKFGSHALGGASLANGLMNATGYGFGAGLSGALETLLSHCYGHNPKSHLFGTHVQRMILLLLIAALPLGLLISNIGKILVWIGQPPDVVTYTANYVSISLWALLPMMLLEVLRRYYAAQHISKPFTVILVVTAAVNVPLQYLMTSALGFIGAPVAWLILLVAIDAALIGYLVVTGLYRNTWGGWGNDALQHWGPMLRLSIPSLAMTLCEWSAMEINSIASGFAPAHDLAAYTILGQLSVTLWTMPSGNFMASSVLVGGFIGERRPMLARTYALASLAVTFTISCCSIATVLLLGEAVPRFFSDDPTVIATFMKWRWWTMLFHFGDAYQSTMLGIFHGIGKQTTGAIIVSLSFLVIGLPLGLGLFLRGAMSVVVLVIGPLVGVYVAGVPLFTYFFFKTKWQLLEPHGTEVPPEVAAEEKANDAA